MAKALLNKDGGCTLELDSEEFIALKRYFDTEDLHRIEDILALTYPSAEEVRAARWKINDILDALMLINTDYPQRVAKLVANNQPTTT